jgi:hypothetical protein
MVFAPKGPNNLAQGNALGTRETFRFLVFALKANPQGVALGYVVRPLRGKDKRTTIP